MFQLVFHISLPNDACYDFRLTITAAGLSFLQKEWLRNTGALNLDPDSSLLRLRTYLEFPVVGSITFPISVILVAGKPLSSACRRIMASSFARYTQNILFAAMNDSFH